MNNVLIVVISIDYAESLKRHLQSLAKKAKIKLSYSNLLYEVSRLQFLMQHLINDRNKIA